jgi:hypothetical protein
MLTEVLDLIESWRQEVELHRRRGRQGDADFLESIIGELEAALNQIVAQCALPADAAARSGYSAVQISRLIATDAIATVDTPGGKMVRLIDMPVKLGKLPALLGLRAPDPQSRELVELQERRLSDRRAAIRMLG